MKLSDARDEYLRSRASQGYKPGTINNNRKHINRLVRFTSDLDTRRINPQLIDRFFAHAALDCQAGALGNLHATLTGFFRWCRGRGYMKPDQDPMAGRRAPKHVRRPRQLVPLAEFPALLDAAEQRSKRDRAVIALGLYTMLRQSEIRTLRIKDFDPHSGELSAFRHKTDTYDYLPISEELGNELRTWLTYYAQHVGQPLDPNWYLVPARQPNLYGARTDLQRLNPTRPITNMHNIAKEALGAVGFPIVDENGEPTREGMHTLRRSAARALFDELSGQGYDRALRLVQTFLGHSAMVQTEKYIQVEHDRKTRNDVVGGKPMFPSLKDSTVTRLDEYREGHG